LEMGSHERFACADFELQSSWSQPLKRLGLQVESTGARPSLLTWLTSLHIFEVDVRGII
jgi:hypothetical protein